MKSRTRMLLGSFILLLSIFMFWQLIMPMTPKNYKRDAFILSKIKQAYESGNIDTAIESLKSESKIKAAASTTFDKDKVLIVNPDKTLTTSNFIAICHIDRCFPASKGALVLYGNGELKRVKNWTKLINDGKDLEFYEVVLE